MLQRTTAPLRPDRPAAATPTGTRESHRRFTAPLRMHVAAAVGAGTDRCGARMWTCWGSRCCAHGGRWAWAWAWAWAWWGRGAGRRAAGERRRENNACANAGGAACIGIVTLMCWAGAAASAGRLHRQTAAGHHCAHAIQPMRVSGWAANPADDNTPRGTPQVFRPPAPRYYLLLLLLFIVVIVIVFIISIAPPASAADEGRSRRKRVVASQAGAHG